MHPAKEDFMVKSRRVFTREFKLAAVKELESGRPLGYVARRLEVIPPRCNVGAASSNYESVPGRAAGS